MSHTFKKFLILFMVSACLFSQIHASDVKSKECGDTCCENNALYVNGNGRVSVQPDIAYLTVGVSVTARTSKEAIQGVATKISEIIKILLSNGINKSDIQTKAISIYPQYSYPNGTMTLVGQTAQQSLIVTFRQVDKNGGNIGNVIDELSQIDGVQISNLRFDKEDKSEAQKQARKLAFADAQKKAQQFAQLAGRTICTVLTVVDNTVSNPPATSVTSFAKIAAPTTVPVGQLDVYYNIDVKFGLK